MAHLAQKLDFIDGEDRSEKLSTVRGGTTIFGMLVGVAVIAGSIYYAYYQFAEAEYDSVTSTTISSLADLAHTIEIQCNTKTTPCYFSYMLSNEFTDEDGECRDFTQPTEWRRRKAGVITDMTTTEVVNTDLASGLYCFRSNCIEVDPGDSLIIDNFTPLTNPLVGGLHIIYDMADAGEFGILLPDSESLSENTVALFEGAHFFTKYTVTDYTTDGPGNSVAWVNEVFSATVYEGTMTAECPATASFTNPSRTELYMKTTGIDLAITFTSPFYSILGEIGGMSELLVTCAVNIMFVYWVVYRRLKGLPRSVELEESEKACMDKLESVDKSGNNDL
jgi:hypothetical protein